MSGKKPDKGKGQQLQQLPVLDRSKANDMNMMVLKRIDSQIEEILANAGHVCLYRMGVSPEDQQWQRKNIEGSLFLIKRRTQPRFQMLVLNKLSTDNYIETVHGGLEMETNPPYLMYTHGNDEIHGIWFYDEHDLHRLAGLLQKILNQLPKPDGTLPAPAAAAAASHYQPAPTAAVQEACEPAPAPAVADGPAGDGDTFWDRSVHVTEDTLPSSQQLVPNSSLLTEPSGGSTAGSTSGGLQGLLMAAQQKHSVAQRVPALPTPAPQPTPVPNSTSMPAEPAAAGLLTPAFFEQQKAKQQQQPAAAAASASTPGGSSSSAPVAAPVQQSPAPAPAAAAAAVAPPAAAAVAAALNGSGGNALHQLLSRAAKHTPSGPSPSGSGSGGGAVRSQPQPPLGVLSPEAVHDKVKTLLIRLANNDAFVDMLSQELKTVGLLQ